MAQSNRRSTAAESAAAIGAIVAAAEAEGEAKRKAKERKKAKGAWQNSKSKSILRCSILDESIPFSMDPETVYAMNSAHAKWEFKNWANNLTNLRSAIAGDKKRNADDTLMYASDLLVINEKRKDLPIPWHKTSCPNLLKEDVNAGLYQMKPSELWALRAEYQAFDLKVFRKHIHQEIDSRPKRTIRFEKKKGRWKYPEVHEDHTRLRNNDGNS